MVFNRQGTFLRRFIHGVVSLTLRLFFRQIETVNASDVPYKGALIFVMNHPNGLVDPSLVFVALPRKISFLAKSTLFKIPVLTFLLRLVETLPVYRRIDSADVSKNSLTFEACHDLLQKEGAIALFPEGVSHNSPKLLPIKTGAARIALGTLSGIAGDADFELRIVPVGLYYTNKTTFRSEALLHFGESFVVEHPVLGTDGDLKREDVNALTEKIEKSLLEVTINAETQAQIDDAGVAANLFFSVSETLDFDDTITERFEFVRTYLDEKEDVSDEHKSLTEQVSFYKEKLRELGLEPENLALASRPTMYVVRRFILRGLLLLSLSPFALLGSILHFPAYQISKFLASRYTHHGVDDIISTVKIIAGLVLIPLTWFIAAGLLFYFTRSLLSLAVIPCSFLLGYISLRSWEEYAEMRGWLKAVWLFFTKRKVFRDLIRERRRINRGLREFKK